MDLITRIKECKTMPQLDLLRMELVTEGKQSVDVFKNLQSEFIKEKNQLKRIPLSERTW